ncbi:MAG: sulfite exporter TauE/SafE family protein [Pelolinea sp.]|nr:sulfite exporter TauE/SafE family protein [Pelolinea sp.]
MIQFLLYVLVGFTAQTIDGALGMAYGVSCTSFLLAVGVPAALASASVHVSEVFTTFVSGISHFKLGNVDRKLFKSLLIPGILGGVIGAYVLTNFPGDALKPYISAYLLLMGIRIIYKSIKEFQKEPKEIGRGIYLLGFVGGMMDAVGGGGWGPIVTSTLVARGNSARTTIGSVNASEFFVTLAEAIVFLIFLKMTTWQVIAGLIVGGVIAAPLAAIVTKKLDPRKLMLGVGILISLLSLRTIYLAIF